MEKTPDTLPALFIGHGNPMNTLEDNRYTQVWQALGQSLPRPRAILAISAHWYIDATAVTAMAQPRTIHDFGGFPQALFDFQYPAPGAPALAARIQSLLAPLPVIADHDWGLDHGTWSILAHLFPQADIPVVQLSIAARQPAAFHYHLGKQLAALRDEGVLIVGSGMSFHNLRARGPQVTPVAEAWDAALTAAVTDPDPIARAARIAAWDTLPHARFAHPEAEHLLPLMVAIGAGGDDAAICEYRDVVLGWVVSGYRFG